MNDILLIQTATADELVQVLTICLNHSSRSDPFPVDQWLIELKDRNDVSSAPIQQAIALCRNYAKRADC